MSHSSVALRGMFTVTAPGQSTRVQLPAVVSVLLLLITTPARAVLFTDTVLLETSNQSMWSQGPSTDIRLEQFLGLSWGTYRPHTNFLGFPIAPKPEELSFGGFVGGESNNVCIGIDGPLGCAGFRTDIDTTTGLKATLLSSGQVGPLVGLTLRGGSIDVKLPVMGTVALPDQITAGELFRVTTTGATQAEDASITAKAPSFNAFVDGVFNTENHFSGEGCVLGECAEGSFDADLNLGRFSLLEVDSSKESPWSIFGVEIPGVDFIGKITKRAPTPTNPDGIDETPPVDPNPLKPPILLEAELHGLVDKTGGVVTGNQLAFQTNHDVLEAQLSLTGLLETLFPIAAGVGVLKNRITLVDNPISSSGDIKLSYTIANVSVGPVLGLQQEFDLDPTPAVRLQFDKPVTRMEQVQIGTNFRCDGVSILGSCLGTLIPEPIFALRPVTHDDGIVEIVLGEYADLSFDAGIGQLLDRTYFLSDPSFSNNTSLTLAAEGRAEFLCLGLTGIGEGCLYEGALRSDSLSLSALDEMFTLDGFNEVKIEEVHQFNGAGGGTGTVPPPAPEPGALALMLLGGLGFVVVRAKRPSSCRNSH